MPPRELSSTFRFAFVGLNRPAMHPNTTDGALH
jgi:hypothetical protein